MNNFPHIDFVLQVAAWCRRNGIEEDSSAVAELFLILNEYFELKKSQKILQPLTDYKQLRMARGLKAVAVSKATGLSRTYISYMENGKIRNPRADYKKKLDDFYGLRE